MKKVIKNYFTVISGIGLSRGLSFATSLILARDLGAHGFGVFTVFFAVMMLVWQLPTIIDAIYVRYAKVDREEKRIEYIRTSAFMKGVIFIILIISAFPLSYLLAHFGFRKPELVFDLTLAIIGGASLSLLTSVAGIFQAQEKFHIFSVLNALFYGVVFLSILSIISFHSVLNTGVVSITYCASAVIIGFFGAVYLYRITKPPFAINTKLLSNMVGFGKWLLLAMLIDLFLQRIDILVLARLISYEQLGIYSVAVRIAMFATILTSSSTAIFMPRGCESLKSHQHLKLYFKESLMVTTGLIIPIVIMIIFSPYLIRIFFGVEYIGSLLASRILLLDSIFILLYTPFIFLFYANGNTQKVFIFALIKLAIVIFGMFLLVPVYGSAGAALSLAASSFLCLLLVVIWLSRLDESALFAFKCKESLIIEEEKCLIPQS